MGPTLIFDKSVLESLNPDEAMWLDNFFLSNITPLFFIETLADLEKEMKAGRTAEQVVGSLAYKTPDASSKCNAHHATLLAGELLGAGVIKMEHGRPIISGGQTKELGGNMGILFEQSPEEEAFHRWRKGEFLELERLIAKKWRNDLSNVNLREYYDLFQPLIYAGKPRTLEEVRKLTDFYIEKGQDQESFLLLTLSLLGFSEEAKQAVLKRWLKADKPRFVDFAPYFNHVIRVDLFFYIAIAAGLIGHGRPSHKIDLAYLYYLPFCMVFTSNDKLHREIVRFFLKEDQTFVLGTDLKADLAKIDAYYDKLPAEMKARGVISFAFYPPTDKSFLVSNLWDKHMASTWRECKIEPKPQPDSEDSKKILEEMRRFEKEGTPVSDENRVDSDKAHHIVIKRSVYPRKGKWTRFPPEVLNRRKNQNGEWENISNST